MSVLNKCNLLTLLFLNLLLISCNNDDGIVPPAEEEKLIIFMGTVMDSISNQPVVSASVTVNEKTIVTDSIGKFKYDSLKVGTYLVSIVHIDYDTTTFELELQSNLEIDIKLKSEKENLLIFMGTVIDSISNQPITFASVTVNENTIVTDSTGTFKFDSLKVGTYQVSIIHIDYDTTTFELELQNNLEIDIKLKSEKENLLIFTGTVIDSISNQPITFASVTVNENAIVTDSTGKFKFDSLKVGTYQVSIEHIDYETTTFELELQGDLEIDVKLKMIFIDYFPLAIGNTWKYEKETSYAHDPSFFGTADWKIVDIIEEDTLTTYQVEETLNGIEIDPWMGDTTYIINFKRTQNIIEYLDHKIHIQYFGAYYHSFDRYYPVSSKDTVEYKLYELEVKLKKETGIIYLHDHYYGGNSNFSKTYIFLE